MGTQVYILDGQGNTITSSLVGLARGLDVNVLNTITAELEAGAGVGISTVTATSPLGVSLTTKDVVLSGTASVQGTVGISGTVSAFITNTAVAVV